jgi:flavodoxin
MDKYILVTYASKYGATKEIAEKIGEVLRRADLRVDVVPVDDIRDLSLVCGAKLKIRGEKPSGIGVCIEWINLYFLFSSYINKRIAPRVRFAQELPDCQR